MVFGIALAKTSVYLIVYLTKAVRPYVSLSLAPGGVALGGAAPGGAAPVRAAPGGATPL